MKTAIKIKPEKYTFRRSVPIYLMLLPGLAYLIINNYLPMAGIVVAFKKLNFKLGIFGSPWNGLDNFKFLFASGSVGTMLRNTICYNLAFIVLGTIIPITVAILLNDIRSKAMARVLSDQHSFTVSHELCRRQLSGLCVFERGHRLYQ